MMLILYVCKCSVNATYFLLIYTVGNCSALNCLYSDCLRLAFMHLIQEELQQVATEWNNHPIRPSRPGNQPAGTPEEMFFMPNLSGARHIYISTFFTCLFIFIIVFVGTQSYIQAVNAGDLNYVQQYATSPGPPGTLEFLQAAQRVMEDHHLHFPSTIPEALNFYLELKTAMGSEMDRVNAS